MLTLQLKSAATDGDIDRLAKLLSKAGPNDRDEEEFTPLHFAAWGGAVGLCRYLMEQKINIDARNHDVQTPLHYAARYGRYETVLYLINAGADITALDRIKYTPLHMAAEANWGVTGWEGSGGKQNQNPEVCRLLIERGADPLALDSFNRTPLDITTNNEEIKNILKQAIQQRRKEREEASRKQALQSMDRNGRNNNPSAPRESMELVPEITKPPEQWDRNDVSKWLNSLGFGQYDQIFAEKAVSGKYLVTKMTQDKLALLIQDEFHREQIWDEIEELKKLKDDGDLAAKKREQDSKNRRNEEDLRRKQEEERRDYEERRQKEMRSLKSRHSDNPTRITFHNNMDHDAKIYWVDFSGEPHLKRFLSPNETYTEDTFEGHVWHVVDDKSGALLKAEVAAAEPVWISAKDYNPMDDQNNLPSYDQANQGRF